MRGFFGVCFLLRPIHSHIPMVSWSFKVQGVMFPSHNTIGPGGKMKYYSVVFP